MKNGKSESWADQAHCLKALHLACNVVCLGRSEAEHCEAIPSCFLGDSNWILENVLLGGTSLIAQWRHRKPNEVQKLLPGTTDKSAEHYMRTIIIMRNVISQVSQFKIYALYILDSRDWVATCHCNASCDWIPLPVWTPANHLQPPQTSAGKRMGNSAAGHLKSNFQVKISLYKSVKNCWKHNNSTEYCLPRLESASTEAARFKQSSALGHSRLNISKSLHINVKVPWAPSKRFSKLSTFLCKSWKSTTFSLWNYMYWNKIHKNILKHPKLFLLCGARGENEVMTGYTERSINTASIPKQLHLVDHGRLDKLNEFHNNLIQNQRH